VTTEVSEAEAVARMSASEYLSAATVVEDLRAALDAELDPALMRMVADAERLVLVGCGGSYAALLTAQYLLERIIDRPVHVFTGKDLLWRRPIWLDGSSVIIFSSFSGETVDVLEALEFATALAVPSIGITGRSRSTLATQCTGAVIYSGTAIYEAPLATLLRLVAPISAGADARPLLDGVRQLPDQLARVLPAVPAQMRDEARAVLRAEHLYLTGAGPLSSLAFKLAPVFMENVRIGASFFDSSEMRHGSIEFLERNQPTLVALLGTDESREITAMIINFVRDRGGQVTVLDAAETADVHPLLTPLVINSCTQWLVAWSAWLRGIRDLDERVYMGKGLLSKGRWP
jgi:fructoselysine-6-P-deglycase FrlB-like protein